MISRLFNRTTQLVIDLAMLLLAYVLAYFVRLEGAVSPTHLRTLAWTAPYVIALYYVALVAFGGHRMSWRYVSIPDVTRIGKAFALASGVLLATRFVGAALLHQLPYLVRGIIPISVTLIASTFGFLGITGVRVLRRVLAEKSEADSRVVTRDSIPTMLIGAGRAGVLVAKEAIARPDAGIRPVGFLDDDPVKLGTMVHGVPVVGTTAQLADLCAKRGAKQALIAMAAASGPDIRRISSLCEAAHIPVKIIPGIFEIVGGKLNLSRIRKVAIDDLLRRDPVQLDEDAIYEVVRNRVVLVTGAGGSIGAELCRQIARFAPRALILVEHAENSLFHIERELRDQFPELPLEASIADIRDRARMETVFRTHRPHVVFHAAAHKHVPMMEQNPGEAIKNNVLGTKTLAELADANGTSEFVMISTDKAVNPTSIMGVSKRAAEIYIQALSQRSKTHFVAVRFGNVLGSAGSVVPIFQEQIARGGPITITHPEMKRYFMTIPEACQLVLQAGAMGRGGEIFVLDMGEPVKIVDLARDLVRLSGLGVDDDIEIQFTGARPGEKMFEELSLADEGAEKTRHPKVFIGRIKPHPWSKVQEFVTELERAAETADGERIRDLFGRFVPEYQPMSAGNGSAAALGVGGPLSKRPSERLTPAPPQPITATESG